MAKHNFTYLCCSVRTVTPRIKEAEYSRLAAICRAIKFLGSWPVDFINPRMAQPQRALVPRFRGDHVGGSNVLLRLAGRPIFTDGETGRGGWEASTSVDGA